MSAATLPAPTLNGTFVVTPEPEPGTAWDPDRIRGRWSRMTLADRREFVKVIGPRACVREYGLGVVEVALAYKTHRAIDARLEEVAALARG